MAIEIGVHRSKHILNRRRRYQTWIGRILDGLNLLGAASLSDVEIAKRIIRLAGKMKNEQWKLGIDAEGASHAAPKIFHTSKIILHLAERNCARVGAKLAPFAGLHRARAGGGWRWARCSRNLVAR